MSTMNPDDLPADACANCLALGNKHLKECPVLTNWWVVKPGMGVVCSVGGCMLEEGESYRLIPMEPALDPTALEMLIGKPKHMDHPVCGDCCTLVLVTPRVVHPSAGRR